MWRNQALRKLPRSLAVQQRGLQVIVRPYKYREDTRSYAKGLPQMRHPFNGSPFSQSMMHLRIPRRDGRDEDDTKQGSRIPLGERIPPIPPEDEFNHKPSWGSRVSRWLGPIGVAGYFLAGKMKLVIVGLKLFKITPILSMVASSFAYSMIFGPAYGCGMVGSILVHECGHLLVLRHYGVPFSPVVFIPFMGAVIMQQGRTMSAAQQYWIAIAGPAAGGTLAFALSALGQMNDSQILLALADFGFMVNLFNLLPIGQLDGGHLAQAIHPIIGVGGVCLGWYMVYAGAVGNPIFFLIILAGTWETGQKMFGYDEKPPGYYALSAGTKVGFGLLYSALIAALIGGMAVNSKRKKSPKQLQAIKEGRLLIADGDVQNGGYDDYFADDEA